eukprot:GHVU01082163.1.p1 GENE.GHVU01082163.1~~GHVU01082163.1.p1  ORF type:complete len:114 (-),score=3.29 GHVU01082163.1:1234-1575(-)
MNTSRGSGDGERNCSFLSRPVSHSFLSVDVAFAGVGCNKKAVSHRVTSSFEVPEGQRMDSTGKNNQRFIHIFMPLFDPSGRDDVGASFSPHGNGCLLSIQLVTGARGFGMIQC